MAVTSDLVYDFGLGLSFTESIALAGILSLTSLGLAAKVLVDEGHLREPIGIRIFTTALIAELIALLLVGLTIGEHTAQMSWSGVLVLLAQIAGFTVVTWVLASRVIPPAIVLLQRLLYVPQLSFGARARRTLSHRRGRPRRWAPRGPGGLALRGGAFRDALPGSARHRPGDAKRRRGALRAPVLRGGRAAHEPVLHGAAGTDHRGAGARSPRREVRGRAHRRPRGPTGHALRTGYPG